MLPPYVGTQSEAGAKATVGTNMLATIAYFRIDRANIYTQFNADGSQTILEGGSQINEGVEVTVAGKLREDLSLFGGFNVINPRVQNNPAVLGKMDNWRRTPRQSVASSTLNIIFPLFPRWNGCMA